MSRKLSVARGASPAVVRTVASDTRELPETATVSGVVQAPGAASCASAVEPAAHKNSRDKATFCIAEIYTNGVWRVLAGLSKIRHTNAGTRCHAKSFDLGVRGFRELLAAEAQSRRENKKGGKHPGRLGTLSPR